MAVDFVATIAFLPGMVLTMGGGFVFGKALGIGPGVALTTLGELIGTGGGAIVRYYMVICLFCVLLFGSNVFVLMLLLFEYYSAFCWADIS